MAENNSEKLPRRIKNSVLLIKMSWKMSWNFEFLVSLNFKFWSGRPEILTKFTF